MGTGADLQNRLPVTVAWTGTSVSAPPGRFGGVLVFYGGVTRIKRGASDEDGQAVLAGALKHADRIVAEGVKGGGWSGLPIEVIATFDFDTGDIILMWRVPFCEADRIDDIQK